MKTTLKKSAPFIYILVTAVLALCFGGAVVDMNSARVIPYHEEIVTVETVNVAKAMDIPMIVLTEEEANERIAKLKEEKYIREKAKAAVVRSVEKHTDDSNRYYLACAICQEVGGLDDDMKMLVGNVIMNRVASKYFPNSIYGVLTQKYQYGMMWKYGIKFPAYANQKMIERCYAVADRLLAGERVCPSNVIFQAEFKQGSGVYYYANGVYFCYG